MFYIKRITKYDYDKYFSIYAWGKSGGSCDAKVKEKKKEIKVEFLIIMDMCVY